MAVDNRDKRASALSVGILSVLPNPNSDIDQGDRQQVIHCYRGILAVESELWTDLPKTAANWTDSSLVSASWTDKAKPSTIWTDIP